MNDCGPMLWATRSRRCFSSARRSLSANAGAGGVMRMLEGIALSFQALVARTATSGLSIAKHANRASSANITRVVFFIFVLLNQPQKAQNISSLIFCFVHFVLFVAKVLVWVAVW